MDTMDNGDSQNYAFEEYSSSKLDNMLDVIANRGKKHTGHSQVDNETVVHRHTERKHREHRNPDVNTGHEEVIYAKKAPVSYDKDTLQGRINLGMSHLLNGVSLDNSDQNVGNAHVKHGRHGHSGIKIASPSVKLDKPNDFYVALRDFILPNEDYMLTIDINRPVYEDKLVTVRDKKHHKHQEMIEAVSNVKEKRFSAVPDDLLVEDVNVAGWTLHASHGKNKGKSFSAENYKIEQSPNGWVITNSLNGQKKEYSNQDFSLTESKGWKFTNKATGDSRIISEEEYLSGKAVVTNVGIDSKANPYYKGKEAFRLDMKEIADLYYNSYYDGRLSFNKALAKATLSTGIHQGVSARNKILSDVMRELTPEQIGIEGQQSYAARHNGQASPDLDDYKRLTNNDIALLKEIDSKYPGVLALAFVQHSKNRAGVIADQPKFAQFADGWDNRYEGDAKKVEEIERKARGVVDAREAHQNALSTVATQRQEIAQTKYFVSPGTNQFNNPLVSANMDEHDKNEADDFYYNVAPIAQ